MDCRECSLKLDALVHDELSTEEIEEVHSHLSECEDCKKEYDEALLMKKRFHTLVEKSEKSLADSVIAQIRNEKSPYKKTPFLVRHIGFAASLVFILVLALYTGVSEVRKNHSDTYVSEMGASVSDADGSHFVADVKNSASLKSDPECAYDYEYAFSESLFDGTTASKDSVTEETEENRFYVDYAAGLPLETEDSLEAEEAPAPEPDGLPEAEVTTEAVRAPDTAKGESTKENSIAKIIMENISVFLPLLSDFEIIEQGEDYIVVNADDGDAVKKIINENLDLLISNTDDLEVIEINGNQLQLNKSDLDGGAAIVIIKE